MLDKKILFSVPKERLFILIFLDIDLDY